MRFLKTAISLALAAFAAVASAQPSTRGNAFTAPAPGVVLEDGDTFTFAWMNLVGERVTLTLMDGASGSLRPITTIATNIPNSGSYEWEVPENIPTSASYTVRISYDSNPANYNYSDRFTVTTDVVATTSAASTTSAPPTSTSASTSASSSASSTSESSSASTSTSTSETETTSASTTVRTTSTRRSTTTSESTGEPTSQGAPPSAGTTTLSSPLAVIMAVLAATLFIH